jgi:HAD superfamily hydrolase (TIGR01509 family)
MPLDIPRIQAICFDVDGTLRDTDDQYAAKFRRILTPFKSLIPRRDVAALARRLVMFIEAPANFLVGIPDRLHLDDEIAALGEWLVRRGITRYKHEYPVIPGIREMLERLHTRYPLAIVSARPQRGTLGFVEHSGFAPLFACVAHGQTTRRAKPAAQPVLWAAAQMGVSPQNCLMVGDTTVDIRAGRAAGAQTLGVLCGFGERAELLKRGADEILDSTAQLADALLGGA